jgi:hypothetical protein
VRLLAVGIAPSRAIEQAEVPAMRAAAKADPRTSWRIVTLSCSEYRQSHDESGMTTQAGLWAIAGAALLLAIAAGFLDHRRERRRDLDRVGWAPWSFVQIAAAFAALAAAALALKG